MSDTAEAPDDFTSFSQRRLSFNRDQSYIQFEVKLENDVNVEFDEIFKVKIVEPYVPDDEGGIVTIHVMDDDSKSLHSTKKCAKRVLCCPVYGTLAIESQKGFQKVQAPFGNPYRFPRVP